MKNNLYNVSRLPNDHELEIEAYFKDKKADSVRPNPNLKTYIICFTNRCGSNYFASALSSDSRLGLAREAFNFKGVINWSERHHLGSLDHYTARQMKRLATDAGIFGVKLGAMQLLYLTKKGIVPTFMRPPVFVRIKRRNTIAQAVSYMIALQTDRWNSSQGGNGRKPEFDVDLISDCMKGIYQSNAIFDYYFDLHQIDPIEVVYEDMADSFAGVVQELSLRLGIEKPCANLGAASTERQATKLNREFEKRFRNNFRF